MVLVLGVTASTLVRAQTAEEVNQANNPLTPKVTLNLQDQWAPRLYDAPGDFTNSVLFRGVVPHALGGHGQILRFTMPVTTVRAADDTETGSGDLNLFNLWLMNAGAYQVGIGPQITLPTASRDETGTGKWQGGLAGVVIAPQSWGLFGTLVTWQHSFAGESDRATQNNLAVQPLLIYNLPQGFYFRSTATWTFDLARSRYFIPIGAGVGKVWVLPEGKSLNLFAEPQWTVAHDGVGQPRFQVFAGVNLQFTPAR
jgi:hypothetical protein